MKLKTLFTVTAAVLFVNALAFLLYPQVLTFHWVAFDPTAQWLARELSAWLFGFAALAWLARKLTDPTALKALNWGFLIAWGIGFGVVLARQFTTLVNVNGWFSVAYFGLFALGYGLALVKGSK